MSCPDKVRAITGSTLTDPEIQPFIDAASAVLTRISEFTDAQTDDFNNQLSAYMSAHLLAMSPVGDAIKQVRREEMDGEFTIEYLTPLNLGEHINSTLYGQVANMLTEGRLGQIHKTPIRFYSIGEH